MTTADNAYFVPSIPGFIPESWRSDGTYSEQSWPLDAVLLAPAVTHKFWKQQAPEGKVLGSVGGKPSWVDSTENPPTKPETEARRLKAYANPVTGSDRLFSEAARMQIMGEDGADEIKSKAIARYKEIQAQYPWPTK